MVYSKEINKVIVVLLDLSESTNKPEIRKLYINSFEKVLEKITHGDALFVAPITEKSMLELSFIVEEKRIAPLDIPFGTNILVERKIEREKREELKSKKEDIKKKIKDCLIKQEKKIFKTDILSSLNMVDERIYRVEDYKKFNKILIIMSDMIEDSDLYNFERENLTPNRIRTIINERKKEGLIPNLVGVKVYVVGAQHRTMKKYLQVKDFWMEYFKKAGAIILPENYSSSCPLKIGD
jgi:hypothetical protein